MFPSARRFLMAAACSIVFAFCLGEALLPEACDGDALWPTAAAAADMDGSGSQGGTHLPGEHVCHCTHTNGALSTHPVALIVLTTERCHFWRPGWLPPPSYSPYPDTRPPIA